MAADSSTVLSRLRRPEYTGENRCIPCTIVNTVLASLAAVIVWVVAGPALAALVFGLSLASIYLRGYLVPGTPELTKRYLPDSILAYFDHHDGPASQDTDIDPEVDLEALLLSADIVTECADYEDLCLTEEFERKWHAEMERVKSGDLSQEILGDLLDVDEEAEITFESFGDAYAMNVDSVRIGTWESEAAFYADVASAEIIPEYAAEWDDLSPEARSGLLASLRLFLESCPACGGPVQLGEETVESCCRSFEVVAVSCTDCGARLFEIEQQGDLAAA